MTNSLKTTRVRVYYYNPLGKDQIQPDAVLIKGVSSKGERLSGYKKGTKGGKQYIEKDLTPGIYCYKVYYDGKTDYGIKYFYLDGTKESVEYTLAFEPLNPGNYMERTFSSTTDEVLGKYFNTDNIEGFKTYDTPTFAYHKNDRVFMSNAELCAFIEDLAARTPCMRVFYPSILSEKYRLRTPVIVFTNDRIPENASLARTASIVRSGGIRDIALISGGIHGNEPAGEEGTLYLACELAGDYGREVLDKFGAVVIIPGVSTDNLCDFQRNYPDGRNANRDLLALIHTGSRIYAGVYSLFMPTLTVSCHEDVGVLNVDESDYSVRHINTNQLNFGGSINAPLYDVEKMADGGMTYTEHEGFEILQRVMNSMNQKGYRVQHYRAPTCFPTSERAYAFCRGAYGFLIEASGISCNKQNYALRVNSELAALKGFIGEAMASDGKMARTVFERRQKAAVTRFDSKRRFILGAELEVCGEDPSPSIYLDGRVKDANAVRPWKVWNRALKSRTMPTAYVFPKDLKNIKKIISLLKRHGIGYTELNAGSSLKLREYRFKESGDKLSVSLNKAENITFDGGAYAVTLDNSDAYLIAYLFEPDSFWYTSAARTVSLFDMGLLGKEERLYRSEHSGIRKEISRFALKKQ